MITRRAVVATAVAPLLAAQSRDVERWDTFDVELAGPRDGNAFVDVHLSAEFRHENRTMDIAGFYDGDGAYRVRFSPDSAGEWTYRTESNSPALDGRTGAFRCTAARNRGPVSVRNTHHFAYADGTPYFPF